MPPYFPALDSVRENRIQEQTRNGDAEDRGEDRGDEEQIEEEWVDVRQDRVDEEEMKMFYFLTISLLKQINESNCGKHMEGRNRMDSVC
jgi:hypothetical protein